MNYIWNSMRNLYENQRKLRSLIGYCTVMTCLSQIVFLRCINNHLQTRDELNREKFAILAKEIDELKSFHGEKKNSEKGD